MDQNLPKISSFFPVLNKIEVLIKENEDLKRKIVLAMTAVTQQDVSTPHISGLLKDLVECASKNSGKKERGWRYEDDLKELSTIWYILGGLQLYEILNANMPIPAANTVKNVLYSKKVVREGEIRMKELKQYLLDRQQPLEVFLSEDATGIDGRLLYHPATNQIVGCVPRLDANGCPIVGGFPATSAKNIASYFENYDKSQYAYVIMAQTLSGAPPFCLCLYGTNNKFNASDVCKRWNYIGLLAKEEGICIRGYAADGDSRLMKTMRFTTFVPNPSSPWSWFHANLVAEQVCFQDFVHLLVKLKSKLLKPSVVLPIGPCYLASKGHLVELIATVGKGVHELCPKLINSKDKMNFKSAEKICQEKVCDLLRGSISESQATAMYLDMMRDTYLSLADPSLAPLHRVELIWEWVIFLRLWRQWVIDNEDYTLANNFITSNAYLCVELNAHALVQCIILFRDAEEPHLFKPWLCSSQPCESLFRSGRSLGTCFNTVITFSLMEFLYKLSRIEFLINASHRLKDKYTFPRNVRAFEAIKSKEYICISLPENYEIENAVKAASTKAYAKAKEMKLIDDDPEVLPLANFPIIASINGLPLPSEDDDEEDDHNELIAEEDDDENQAALRNAQREREEFNNDIDDDVYEDHLDVSGLATFNHVAVTPECPFVQVVNSDGSMSIINKKSTWCWRLSDGHSHQSNDRLLRVMNSRRKETDMRTTNIQIPTQEEAVMVGSWSAFVEDKSLIFGKILAYRFMSGTTLKQQEYSGLFATVKRSETSRSVGALCSWYSLGPQQVLKRVAMESQGYYDLEHYICTIPRPVRLDDGNIRLTCRIADIKKLAKGRIKK